MKRNKVSRSEFLRFSGMTTALLAINPFELLAQQKDGACSTTPPVDLSKYADPNTQKNSKKLNILVLGGTKFFGPPLVQYALERGHDITLLNRGITNPHLFKKVKHIKCDRMQSSDKLYDEAVRQNWDIVIDTWQGHPLVVKESVEALKDRTSQYIYISSISVYTRENYSKPVILEGDAYTSKEPMPANKTGEIKDYRLRKQLADAAVRETVPDKFTTIRCHGIHGYYEEAASPGNRYWPIRFLRGGDIICPGDGQDYIQLVHVQDAARFAIHCAEMGHKGIFHAGKRYPFLEYLMACKAASTNDATLHWLSLEKLTEHKIRPFTDMPGFVPRSSGPGFNNCNDDRSITHGINYRSLADIIRDDITGFYKHYSSDFTFGNTDPQCGGGITMTKEKEVLQKMNLIK